MRTTTASLARLTIAVLACIALYATTATTASADWFIEGSELTGTAALAKTAAVDENFQLKAAGVTVTCKGKNLEGISPQIEAATTASANSLLFTGCSANGNCTVTETIGTVPVLASFTEGTSPAVKAVFSPKTKTIFATIKYNGAECALLGIQPVTGKASTSMLRGQEENILQEIIANIPEATGELKVGSSPAELKGAALLQLATSNRWVFLGNNAVYSFAERVAGSVMSTISFCYFDKTNDWCEIQVEVVKTGAAAALKFAKEDIEPPTEPFIKNGAPAMGAECKAGNKIGAAKAKCYIRLEYTGANNPGKGKYRATFKIQTQEEGGNNRVFNDYIFLEAEKS